MGGGGPPTKNFFFQSEHVSSQIWCQNFFPLPVGGGPSTKKFFSSLNMYQAKSGVKNFSLYHGGGGPSTKNFFFQSEHVSSQIWCQKFFPLLVGEGESLDGEIFFSSLNMYQAKSGVKNFSLYWWGGGGRGSLDGKFFSQSEDVWSQICYQKIFPLLGGGVPRQKNFFFSLNMYQAKSAVKNFSLYRRGGGGEVPWWKIFFPV